MLFHVMWNKDFSETALVRRVWEALEKRLPRGWRLARVEQPSLSSGSRPDAVMELADPEGRSALIIVEAKARPVEAREVGLRTASLRRVRSTEQQFSQADIVGLMLIAPFLGRSARERLTEEDVNFADMTGNLRFALQRPAIYIETQGADKNPWQEDVPLKSLKGRGTGRAVRAFLDYRPPYGTRELAVATQTPQASVSRVAELLEREAILKRESPRGRILSVDWERLLRRWIQDYSFTQSNRTTTWLEPRGTRVLLDKLRQKDLNYALTGSFAAVQYAPIAEPRLVALYVDDAEAAAELLGLRRAETGANVLLAEPFDPVVFNRTDRLDDLKYVRVTQLAADLLTGPGRNPAEAESLIEWMRDREDVWRTTLRLNI